ncbi:hypothetical protein [Yeosuana sp. AK3]
MNKKFRIGISCHEANHVCDKSQYKESTFWEKVKLNVHLLYCKACREYTNVNSKLTAAISDSKVTCMDKNSKEYLKNEFNKALNDDSLSK